MALLGISNRTALLWPTRFSTTTVDAPALCARQGMALSVRTFRSFCEGIHRDRVLRAPGMVGPLRAAQEMSQMRAALIGRFAHHARTLGCATQGNFLLRTSGPLCEPAEVTHCLSLADRLEALAAVWGDGQEVPLHDLENTFGALLSPAGPPSGYLVIEEPLEARLIQWRAHVVEQGMSRLQTDFQIESQRLQGVTPYLAKLAHQLRRIDPRDDPAAPHVKGWWHGHSAWMARNGLYGLAASFQESSLPAR
jgi:hypothetical protein